METSGENIQDLLTAAATLTGIYVALRGLHAWKGELLGKRDIELSQRVIELFYEAKQKVSLLRSPFSLPRRGEARTRAWRDRQGGRSQRFRFLPLARLNEQSAFWQEFFSFKFRMRALFGETSTEAFALVDECLRHFRAAAGTRYQTIRGDRFDVDTRSLRKWEETIWQTSPTDEIAEKMKDATARMEAICIPIVRQREPLWRHIRTWHRKSREVSGQAEAMSRPRRRT